MAQAFASLRPNTSGFLHAKSHHFIFFIHVSYPGIDYSRSFASCPAKSNLSLVTRQKERISTATLNLVFKASDRLMKHQSPFELFWNSIF
jgi:hypothetical protein